MTAKKTRTPRVSLASLVVSFTGGKSAYDATIVAAGLSYWRAEASFHKAAAERLAVLAKAAKTSERDRAQEIVEQSLMISYVAFRMTAANPKLSDDEAIASAADWNALKQPRTGVELTDAFRTHSQEALFAAGRKALSRAREAIGLETRTKGGARKGAGRKGTKAGDASKLVKGADASTVSPVPPVETGETAKPANPPREIGRVEAGLAGGATAGAVTRPATLTCGTLANWFSRMHQESANIIALCDSENIDASEKLVKRLKDAEVFECLARIDQELSRIVNLLDK